MRVKAPARLRARECEQRYALPGHDGMIVPDRGVRQDVPLPPIVQAGS